MMSMIYIFLLVSQAKLIKVVGQLDECFMFLGAQMLAF